MGGTGKDELRARGGRDILIGDADADDLFAGNSEDLLIAGTTAFDLDEVAVNQIQQEWTFGRDFDTRVKNLRGTGTGPRENGSVFLQARRQPHRQWKARRYPRTEFK